MVIINYLILGLFPLGMGSDKVLWRSNSDLEGNFDNHDTTTMMMTTFEIGINNDNDNEKDKILTWEASSHVAAAICSSSS